MMSFFAPGFRPRISRPDFWTGAGRRRWFRAGSRWLPPYQLPEAPPPEELPPPNDPPDDELSEVAAIV